MLDRANIAGLTACMLLIASSSAPAADLGARPSRIGAIFAESPARVVHAPIERDPSVVIVEAIYPVTPRLPGYYGRPRDFKYRNYYGTWPIAIFSRLPYACGFVAAC